MVSCLFCLIYRLLLLILTKNRLNIATLSAVDPSIFPMSTGKTLKFFKSDTQDPYFFPFFWVACNLNFRLIKYLEIKRNLYLFRLCSYSLTVLQSFDSLIPVMLMPDDFRAFTKIKVDNHAFNKENLPSHFKVRNEHLLSSITVVYLRNFEI